MTTEPNLPKEEDPIAEDAATSSTEAAAPAIENTEDTQTATESTASSVDPKTLALEEYPAALKKLTQHPNWSRLNNEVRQLSDAFDRAFGAQLKEKKEAFINEGGNEIDFQFAPTYKKEFSLELREYKKRKQHHYKELEANQKANLNRKREIIEGIKALVDASEQDSNSYQQFKHLQEAFHSTGQVPRNEMNNIWQTYKFHVERYYDFLHLNRDLREADFKHNYTEKLKIIERAEALAKHTDIIAATRELNSLHKLWKNDLGPVAKEHREELWARFQAATKILHQQRNAYNKNIDSIHAENLAVKQEILQRLQDMVAQPPQSHNAWQNALKNANELREKFQTAGPTAKQHKNKLWNEFRAVFRSFNQEKNSFYKNQKAEEREKISQKRVLIEEIKSILASDQWREQVNRVKQLQAEWKKTGRVSQRKSKALWEEFNGLNNTFFDRLNNKRSALTAQELAQQATLDNFVKQVMQTEAPTTPKKLEDFIQTQLEQWEALQPPAGNSAQQKLLTHLAQLWKATSLSAKDKAAQQFTTQLLFIRHDAQALNKLHNELRKEVDQLNNERIQLENNLQFFSNSSADNPVVAEVTKKIEQLTQKKAALTEKTNAIKTLKRQLNKKNEEASSEGEAGQEDAG